MILHLDFETRSTVDLKKTGAYPYALHPETDAWCAAYAFGDEPVALWVLGEPVPERIADNVRDLEIEAWNASFERVLWWLLCTPRYGWPRPEREQFYCVAAAAAAMSLPRKLEDAARVLGLAEQKDDAGHRLMMKMTRPRKPTKTDPRVWWDSAEEQARLHSYCMQDVRTERAVGAKLRRLSASEIEVYRLDQAMNDRGVRLDLPLVRAAQRIVDTGTARANEEVQRITSGGVSSITKVADMTRWLQEAGASLDNIRKDTLRDLLAGSDVEGDVRRVLELRSEGAKSSTAKLVSMLNVACDDSRARGLLLYHGAGTGRWSGRLIQVQNLPRGEHYKDGRPTKIKEPQRFIPAVLAGDYDAIDAEEPALVVVSALLRSMLRSAPGHVLMAGDYAQIEARVLAWIAEQNDLVEGFASGGKIYEEMASLIYGRSIEEIISLGKDCVERQIGKNTILGAGFQMGDETFGRQVQVQTGIVLDEETRKRAIQVYRERYSSIRKFWGRINAAACAAVYQPGSTTHCGLRGSIRFTYRGQFLWCVLPSGRPLAYALPQVDDRAVPWYACGVCQRNLTKEEQKKGVCSGCGTPMDETRREKRPSLSYMGVNSVTRQWRRSHAYGGLLTENVVQAMARDLIAGAMVRLEKHGYRPVLTVHDEAVGEVPIGHGSLDHFLALMQQQPRWAAGLPVEVEGWQGERYRK